MARQFYKAVISTVLRGLCLAAATSAMLVAAAATSHAQSGKGQAVIVALGASNTSGRGGPRWPGGVNRPHAYPAQLQAMLKQRGVNARVINAGVAGDTTRGMLMRMDRAVPRNAQVVILQPGGNDARRGDAGDRSANIATIRQRLEARGVRVIMLERMGQIAPRSSRDPDGQHFNAQGHAAFAAYLLPSVMQALGR